MGEFQVIGQSSIHSEKCAGVRRRSFTVQRGWLQLSPVVPEGVMEVDRVTKASSRVAAD
jgi:hypothetical protein